MAGNTTEYIGLLLTGKAIVIQEDYWGGRSVMSAILPGHTFAESYACTPGSVLDVNVYAEAASSVSVSYTHLDVYKRQDTDSS